jgi:hypothetical protein
VRQLLDEPPAAISNLTWADLFAVLDLTQDLKLFLLLHVEE